MRAHELRPHSRSNLRIHGASTRSSFRATKSTDDAVDHSFFSCILKRQTCAADQALGAADRSPTMHSDREVPNIPLFLFNDQEIAAFPSLADDFNAEEELRERQVATLFIRKLAESLDKAEDADPEIPESAICTAAVMLHRFFAAHSFADFDGKDIATVCLFVACKVGDRKRSMKIFAVHWWRLKVVTTGEDRELFEEILDNAAKFLLALEQLYFFTMGPYRVQLPHVVINSMKEGGHIGEETMQRALLHASDALLLTLLPLKYHFRKIAGVCLQLACMETGVEFDFSRLSMNISGQRLARLVEEFRAALAKCHVDDKAAEEEPRAEIHSSAS